METENTDAATQAAPETRYGEPPTKPDDERGRPEDPGRSEEAQDPDREGGVGPPDQAEPKEEGEPPAEAGGE